MVLVVLVVSGEVDSGAASVAASVVTVVIVVTVVSVVEVESDTRVDEVDLAVLRMESAVANPHQMRPQDLAALEAVNMVVRPTVLKRGVLTTDLVIGEAADLIEVNHEAVLGATVSR